MDPGRQLITVVRKGTRAVQQLSASADAFVWLRLYQVEMDGVLPRGTGQPLWWTLRRPFRPLTYHAVHRMFERAGTAAGAGATLHSLRHTAAYQLNFGYAVAALRGHTGSGSETGVTATYVRASLAEVAAVLAVLTGEPHPLATTEGSGFLRRRASRQSSGIRVRLVLAELARRTPLLPGKEVILWDVSPTRC